MVVSIQIKTMVLITVSLLVRLKVFLIAVTKNNDELIR